MKSNQKIFITGSSSGIGEAIAYDYASHGAILGLAARRSEKLESVKAKCMELGAQDVKNYSLDVSDTKESISVAKDFVGFKELLAFKESTGNYYRINKFFDFDNKV